MFKTILSAAMPALIAALFTSAPSMANQVVEGQDYPTQGLHCGGQVRVTATMSVGPIPFTQYSWIYRNCSHSTEHRKVDIAMNVDGKCYGIGPGKARVLKHVWDPPIGHINQFRGSKPC